MNQFLRHPFAPTFLMLIALLTVGVFLAFGTDTHIDWPGFISMLCFYMLIFFMGNLASRKKGNQTDDVILAGRSLPLGVAVCTMSATWLGGGYINGTAEYTYSLGLVWVQAPWGYALSLIIGGLFFAKTMRHYRFRTMLDPLSQRFGDKTAALFFIPALLGETFWTAAILTALGSTFGVVLGLDFHGSIILSAAVAIAYTALGGLWAVALTDLVQMFLLFAGLIMTIPFALESVGGWDQAWGQYEQHFGRAATLIPSREALGSYYWNWWDYAMLLIFGGIPWQVYFQRVLSSKDENTARNLSVLAGVVCLFAAIFPCIIGVIGFAADWGSMGVDTQNMNNAVILPMVMKYCTPGWVSTIGLGAIAAAVMSSADSSILSASSMASWNIYRPFLKPNITPSQLSAVIKKCIWILGITATLIALRVQSIYALWFLCSDLVYCLLFPALTLALFDKKANKYGAITGFIIAAILRFGGGDATLGLPILLDYPIIDAGEELKEGARVAVLFPFRTLAMLSGLCTNVIISRCTQKQCPSQPLSMIEETTDNNQYTETPIESAKS